MTYSHHHEANSEAGSLVAIIPAYNEELTAGEVIRQVKRYVDKVILVDDASSDSTARRAEEAGAYVIRHQVNRGIGAALHTGYAAALAANPGLIVQLDADGQHDPKLLPNLLDALDENTDIVIGSRFLAGTQQDYSFIRRWGIRFFSFLTTALGGKRISDVTSGYRIYRPFALSIIPPSRGRHWAVEQTLKALRLNLNIKEVGIPIPPRRHGESQFRPEVALLYPLRMLLCMIQAIRVTSRSRDRGVGYTSGESLVSRTRVK